MSSTTHNSANEGDPDAGAALHRAFPKVTSEPEVFRGDVTVQVDAASEIDVVKHARDDLGYTLFIDRLGADRGEDADPRFDVITILYNITTHKRLHIRTTLPAAHPETPTLRGVFRGADWFEREIYDMYGVIFTGHPNLKRILMMERFEHFPLRKEYPTEGLGEFAAPRRAIGGTVDSTSGDVAITYVTNDERKRARGEETDS